MSRDSARMVISAIMEGLRHTRFCHFPQTKPISANEATSKKANGTMLQDEQHAPLRSGGRTRLLCACSGAAGSAFCQPVQIDEKAPCNFSLLQGACSSPVVCRSPLFLPCGLQASRLLDCGFHASLEHVSRETQLRVPAGCQKWYSNGCTVT